MSILNITETGFDDDSIEEYEYFEYLPIVGAINNLNNNGGDIAINIETQDIFMHPSLDLSFFSWMIWRQILTLPC